MITQPSLLATAIEERPRSLELDARIFWMASKRFRALRDDGRLILAAMLLDEIRTAGETLLSGPRSGHALGRRMAQMGAQPFPGGFFVSKIRDAR